MKRLRGRILPRLQYKNNFLESGLLLCENPADQFRVRVRLQIKKKGAVNLSLEAQAKDDLVNTTINWGNNAAVTYAVANCAAILTYRREQTLAQSNCRHKPTDVILNDTIWEVHLRKVVVDSGKIDVNDFYLVIRTVISESTDASDNPADTVKLI